MIKLAIVLPCYNEEEVLRESAGSPGSSGRWRPTAG